MNRGREAHHQYLNRGIYSSLGSKGGLGLAIRSGVDIESKGSQEGTRPPADESTSREHN